jgi:iron complex transport system substrate-binding protein
VIVRIAALAALLALMSGLWGTAGAAGHGAARRVISLIPSLTEDLFAVGAGDRVVGRSEYSDYPPQARRLPVVASFASIDAERIVALHPDLVVAIPSQQGLAGDLVRTGIPVAFFRDDSLDDVYADLHGIGALVGRTRQADALVARLRTRTRELTAMRPRRARRPSVFVVLGTAPIFTVGRGSYIDSLLELAGARNAAADVRAPYARYSAEALVARQPDALIVDPDVHLNDVAGAAPWSALRAVRRHHVYVLPDAAILERPGPRYNEGLAWLIATLRAVPV